MVLKSKTVPAFKAAKQKVPIYATYIYNGVLL